MKRKQLTYLILFAASLFDNPSVNAQPMGRSETLVPMSRTETLEPLGRTETLEPQAMTLRDCLLYAREHAHRVKAARLAAEEAMSDVHLSSAAMMPRLELYGNGNISFGRNIDPATNTYDNKQTLSTGFGLQASIPVFDGLVNFNNLRSARVSQRRSQVRVRLEEDEVLTEVIKQFYQVIYCKAMVVSAEEQLRRDSTDLAATVMGERLGSKSGADVAEIEALVATDRYQVLNQHNLLDKAYLDLRSAMGMSLHEPLPPLIENRKYCCESAEKRISKPILSQTDSIPSQTDSNTSSGESNPDFSDIPMLTPETMLSDMSQEHPRIEDARLAVEGSRYDLLVAKGFFSPSISLSGGISTSYYKMLNTEAIYPGFGRQARDNMGEYIGISIGIPLFDGLYNINRLKKARIRLKENELQLEDTRYQLDKETTQAAMDYKGASEEFEAARRRVEAEEIAFRATRRKYELGDASALDLYTASGKLASAKALEEGKRIQKIINLITWRYCMGIPLLTYE